MSLITYPIATAFEAFCPQNFAAQMRVNQRAHASPFGGSEQVVDMLNDRWAVTMDLPPCTQADAGKREAFFNALRGQVNHTELYHFGRPTPRGTLASAQGLIVDAPQGAASVTIATTPGATLLAGDMLGVDGLLLQCAANCVADGSGVLVVPLVNRLRRAITGLRRASTATYIDGAGVLQTAAVNVPRFQDGQLLVEVAATNLQPYSADLSSSPWVLVGASLDVNAEPSPDGLMAAEKIVESSANSLHGAWQAKTLSTGFHTISFYAKAAERTVIAARGVQVGDVGGLSFFDLAAGSASPGPGATASIFPVSGGYFRCVMTLDATTTPGFEWGFLLVNGSGDVTYAGDGSSGAFVWGAQLEAGAAATSYIPTTTAPATRAADIITPVVWDRPTAPFRLASSVAPRYVAGYAEGLSLDFVEKVD